MDNTFIRKAVALIAKGIMKKERLLEQQPNRYPYCAELQHGINMFLYASMEWGGLGERVFEFANESSFLKRYASIPVEQWFDDWDSEILKQMNLKNEPFFGFGAFAFYKERANKYLMNNDCVEFLETQESNIIEGTDEYAVYEMISRLAQDDYVIVRKFIIEHPVMTIDERREFLLQVAGNAVAREAIELAYEQFLDEGYRCPVCGWTMTDGSWGLMCHSRHCVDIEPNLDVAERLDGTAETIYRLKKGVMRYFAQPGKLELEIVNFCEKKKIGWRLWPQMDRFDVEIIFPDGEVWEIDAKAYRNPIALRNKIENDNGFPDGEYERGYFVVPTEFTRGNQQYTKIVNSALDRLHQTNVRCITMSNLKVNINRKVAYCREKYAEKQLV